MGCSRSASKPKTPSLIVGSRDKQQHGVGKKTKKLKKVVGVK
jgi:hypothetical protein